MRALIFLATAAAALLLNDAASAQTAADRDAYLAQCRRDLIAAYPNARAQADAICASQWDEAVAAGPMAAALLAWAPATGGAFSPAAVDPRSLRGLEVSVNRSPAPGVTIRWFRNGEPIPFRLEDALRVRGAELTAIGCMSFGASEGQRVYRVAAPGKAPFALTISYRSAALASQSSDYAAVADYGGRAPTLAALRRDGADWSADCPT